MSDYIEQISQNKKIERTLFDVLIRQEEEE